MKRHAKLWIFQEGGRWWLHVPAELLRGGERGLYHRRTFVEILKLHDFYLARARGPRLVQRKGFL